MYFIAGLFVWIFIGVPILGFVLWILTAPYRAARNAAARRRPRPTGTLDDIKLRGDRRG